MARPNDLHTGRTDPAMGAFSVVPSDTDFFPHVVRALYVGTSGDVTVVPWGGDEPVTFKSVPAGLILPVISVAVRATGTSATDIVGLR